VNQTELLTFAERLLDAWNSQDVERVVACYTENVQYRDPNTRGTVEGAEAMRHYLRKLFASWTMHWTFHEGFPFAGHEGAAVLWHASIRRADGGQAVEVDGMDLVLLRGDKIERNEVYFDRLVLQALLQS
jgi:ketosteroid isomerase-like protein